MNKMFKDKTLEYVSFLKKYINDIYSGKMDLDKDECQEIDECFRGLNDVINIFSNIISTTCLDYFNGNYDMTIKNTGYYLNNICDRYSLKIIKDKKLARWTVFKGDKKFTFTCHYCGPKDINNIYNNFISFDYIYPNGRHLHEDIYSFSDLDWALHSIFSGFYE